MNNIEINGKCLYTPGGAAREYAPVGCNFYRGCPHKCLYCYNRKGRTAAVLGIDHAVLRDEFTNMERRPKKYRDLSGEDYALIVFKREVDRYLSYLRQAGIFFSFTTDPMLKDTIAVTLSAMLYAVGKGIPVRILTKNTAFTDVDWTVFKNLPIKQRQLIHIGFTLTGRDDQEPYASPNSDRIAMLRQFHELGYNTFASIEPVVDFESSYRMVKETLGFCNLYMIGLMNHAKDYYKPYDGHTFHLKELIRNVFVLQQLYGFKIYYKESVVKNAKNILYSYYMEDLKLYRVDISSERHGSLYDYSDNRTYIQKMVNALTCLNQHLQSQMTAGDRQDCRFFLAQYHQLFVKDAQLTKHIHDFMASPDSFFSGKIGLFYYDIGLLQAAITKFQNIIVTLFGDCEAQDQTFLKQLRIHAAIVPITLLETKKEIENTKPLIL